MSDQEINPTAGRQDWGIWPRHNAAVVGFRNYWYPVMLSRKLRCRPVSVFLLGERIMFIRDGSGNPQPAGRRVSGSPVTPRDRGVTVRSLQHGARALQVY